MSEHIGLLLRLSLDPSVRPATGLRRAAAADDEVMLHTIDRMLKARTDDPYGLGIRFQYQWVADLEKILTTGGSVWAVTPEGDGLMRRVTPELLGVYSQATASDNPAATYLSTAWKAAFGRDPQPNHAISEAVRAVEDAAGRLISPRDQRYQLNKVAIALRDQRNRFTVAYATEAGQPDPIDLIASLMEWLIRAQAARHGQPGSAPVEHTQQEAEMAVGLAALLVAWFSGGHISRIDGS